MTVVSRTAAMAIDAQLRTELWRRITERLADGRTLVTRRHFQAAIEAAYCEFTGQVPPPAIRRALRRMIEQVHADHPETFLARGVQNAVQKAFGHGVETLAWDVPRVQRHGTASVRHFLQRDRIRGLLHDIRLDPALVDISACVRHGISRARQAPSAGAPLAVPPQPGAAPAAPPSPFIVDDASAARPAAAPETRTDAADADGPEAPWLQVFVALQRLRTNLDPLLRLLLRHKEHVIGDGGDRTPLMTELLRGRGCLDLVLAVMERGDPELQRLAERKPPYDVLPPPGAGVTAPTVSAAFLDDLRHLGPDDYGARLRATDAAEAARAREQLRGFVRLLDQLLTPTPFRRKVRLLLVNRVLQENTAEVEHIYATTDATEARRRSEGRLARAMERVLAEATLEETEAARKRGLGLLMAIEQKLDLDADAEQTLASLAEVTGEDAAATEGDADADDEENLSDIEVRRGAQRVEVSVRVNGKWRRIRGTVMPSPEDSQRWVLVQRNTATGELVPQTRRGRPRFVDRKPDGSWQALTG